VSEWLTYADAASRFGVSSEAVRQIAIRRKWPRRRPNDNPFGPVQVLIPLDAAVKPRTPVQHPSERPLDGRPTEESDALREFLDRERERADRAESRADAAEIDRRAAEARADAADADRRVAQARADAAEGRAHRAEERAAELRGRLDGLQAEAERTRTETQEGQEAAHTAERLAEVERVRADEEAARATGLDRLLADAEHRLTEAEQGRATAQERLDAMDRADVARRGKGRWARLRAAWRGE
jgi:hypothetical protein